VAGPLGRALQAISGIHEENCYNAGEFNVEMSWFAGLWAERFLRSLESDPEMRRVVPPSVAKIWFARDRLTPMFDEQAIVPADYPRLEMVAALLEELIDRAASCSRFSGHFKSCCGLKR
jgi:hypothetical protein